MLRVIYKNKFSKDFKRMKKRGKNMEKLKKIAKTLSHQKLLPKKYEDHALIGNYANRRECHIDPDWLLIYKLEKDCIIFERTGTHADLF